MKVILILEDVSPRLRRNRLAKIALRLRHHKQVLRDATKTQNKLWKKGITDIRSVTAGDKKHAAEQQIARFSRALTQSKNGDERVKPQSRYVKPLPHQNHNVQWRGGKLHQSGWVKRGKLDVGGVYKLPSKKGERFIFTGRYAKQSKWNHAPRAKFVSMKDDSVWDIHPHAVIPEK